MALSNMELEITLKDFQADIYLVHSVEVPDPNNFDILTFTANIWRQLKSPTTSNTIYRNGIPDRFTLNFDGSNVFGTMGNNTKRFITINKKDIIAISVYIDALPNYKFTPDSTKTEYYKIDISPLLGMNFGAFSVVDYVYANSTTDAYKKVVDKYYRNGVLVNYISTGGGVKAIECPLDWNRGFIHEVTRIPIVPVQGP